MKYLLVLFILIYSLIAAANEFNFSPRYTIGAGFVEEKSVPHYYYHSEVIGTIYSFNNERPNELMSVNLLGLGVSYNSQKENFLVLSPLSFVYNRHWSVAYNLHLEKLNYGFSLNYQF